MRDFTDADGQGWTATTAEEAGEDYKGRRYLLLRSADGATEVELRDVRWNNERTAQRTLATMSVIELRRKLRAAVGRSASVPAS